MTRELVDFLASIETLPPEVIDRARYLLLDFLGVAIRGSRAESSQPVYRMIERAGASGNATIIGTGKRTSPGYAALANGTAAHAIELDDTHNAGSIHLGVVMFPVALALGDVADDRFFAAVVAGYEAAARVAMAVQPKEHYLLGFHPTSTCGVFGAAVTAGKILGLNNDQLLSAVGIAGSMAAGSLEFLADGAWTKRLQPGLAAQNGIQAAMLAAEGFRGPAAMLEGRNGFLRGYSRAPKPELLTHQLGQSFELMRTSVKPHACCRYMQGPIDALIELVREHDIPADQIDRIEVAVLEAGWPLVVEPPEQKYSPQSVAEAQFSMPFGAAMAVLCRAAGLDQFTDANIHSSEVRRMMGRVVVLKDSSLEKNFPKEWPASASIQLRDGRRFENFIRHPQGDPLNPLSFDELAAKFRSLAGAALPAEQCDRIVEQARLGSPRVLLDLIE